MFCWLLPITGARTALLDASAAPALDSVSEYLYRSTGRAHDAFRELDVRREGSLDYDQLPALFRMVRAWGLDLFG